MSLFRSSIVLGNGAATSQWSSTARDQHQHVFIPLNADGSAVLTANGSGSVESAVTIRAAAVLTNAYVVTTAVDMSQWSKAAFLVTVDTAQAKTCNIKVGYSFNGTTWYNYKYATYATSGSDLLVSYTDWRADLDISSTANYWTDFFEKRAKYIALLLKSDATTTGKVVAVAQRFN